ncbi:MAG: hypothetical protein ACOYK6_08895 [Chthoniobacterales bacterium]
MKDLTNSLYFQLLSTFLTSLGQSQAIETINKEEGIIEWIVDDLVVRLMPYTLGEEELQEPNAVFLEADLMLLDLENRELNHDRFLILHQLNSVSRMSTGIIAVIDEKGMLSINKIIFLDQLDQTALSKELDQLISTAEELYKAWNELAELFDLKSRDLVAQQRPRQEQEKSLFLIQNQC